MTNLGAVPTFPLSRNHCQVQGKVKFYFIDIVQLSQSHYARQTHTMGTQYDQ